MVQDPGGWWRQDTSQHQREHLPDNKSQRVYDSGERSVMARRYRHRQLYINSYVKYL